MKRLALVCALFALLSPPASAATAPSVPRIDAAALHAAGGHLAVVWDRALFVASASHPAARRVALPASARDIAALRWADDGSALTFAVGAVAWTAAPDGSAAHAVVSACPGEASPCVPLHAPDSDAYAYVVTPSFPKGGFAWSDSLYTVHPPAKPVRSYHLDNAGIEFAAWYGVANSGVLLWPDPMHSGSLAADGLDLIALPLHGPPSRLLTMLPRREWLAFDATRGRMIAVAGQFREAWTSKKIARCDVTHLTCTTLPLAAGFVALDPAWSPVEARIAYVRAKDRGNAPGVGSGAALSAWIRSRVLVVDDPGGAHPRVLLQAGTGIYAPAFTRDGGALTYVRSDALWVLPLRGARPRSIVGPFPHAPDAVGDHGEILWSSRVAWSPR